MLALQHRRTRMCKEVAKRCNLQADCHRAHVHSADAETREAGRTPSATSGPGLTLTAGAPNFLGAAVRSVCRCRPGRVCSQACACGLAMVHLQRVPGHKPCSDTPSCFMPRACLEASFAVHVSRMGLWGVRGVEGAWRGRYVAVFPGPGRPAAHSSNARRDGNSTGGSGIVRVGLQVLALLCV